VLELLFPRLSVKDHKVEKRDAMKDGQQIQTLLLLYNSNIIKGTSL